MKEITRESALEALEQIRKEAQKNGTSDMTLDEINAEIDEVRKAMVGEKAMKNLQEAMSGAAEEAGLKSEDDVVDMVKGLLDRTKTPVTDLLTGILKGADGFDDDGEELYRCLREGLEDQENGRTRPLEEAIEDMRDRRNAPSGEFAEQILKELIDEGYSGYELLDEFRIRQAKVRPAVEAMLEEAKNVANGNGEYMTHEEFVKEVAIDSDAYEEDGEVPDAETIAAMNEYYQMKAHPEKCKRYASLKDAMDPIEYMGYQEGLEIGIKIGENNVNKSASLKMYQDGYSPEYIAKLLQVSSEQVMKWIEEK